MRVIGVPMIGDRTIVGSYPHRRQLRGREAIERALALCKAWPPDEDIRDDSPSGAVARAYWRQMDHGGNVTEAPNADWLPPLVVALDREELERLLAGGTVEALDGRPRGIDEVAP